MAIFLLLFLDWHRMDASAPPAVIHVAGRDYAFEGEQRMPRNVGPVQQRAVSGRLFKLEVPGAPPRPYVVLYLVSDGKTYVYALKGGP